MTSFGRLASAILFTASAQSDLDFVIENSTGYTISEVYMSPTKRDNWGKQILSSPLKNGEKRKIVAGDEGARILAIGGTPGKVYEPPEYSIEGASEHEEIKRKMREEAERQEAKA